MKVNDLPLQTEEEQMEETKKKLYEYLNSPEAQRKIASISTPWVRATPKIGMNDPCPCGSGKKYKKCCYLTNLPKYVLKGEEL